MIIRTSQDAALVSCCPCDPPACDAPRKECQSMNGSLASVGYYKPQPAEPAAPHGWQIYDEHSALESVSVNDTSSGHSYTSSGTDKRGLKVDKTYTGKIGSTGTGCTLFTSTETEVCEVTGSSTLTDQAEIGGSTRTTYTRTGSVVSVAGTESAAHQSWTTAATGWDAANPDYAAAHAAWVDALQAYNTAYATWESDYAAWVAGGEVGTQPEEPVGPPVEPPARPTEPAQNYPACTFKFTYVETTYNWAFTDGSWVSTPVTTTTHSFDDHISTFFGGGTPGGTTYSYVDSYINGVTFAGWVSAAKVVLEAALVFDLENCPLGASCGSLINVPAEAPADGTSVLLEMTKARYRLGIPAAWANFAGRHANWVTAHATWVAAAPETRGAEPIEPTERTYFAAQWDEVFFPKAWEAWHLLKVAYDNAVTAHAAWVAAPGDPPVPEPVVPVDPGPAPAPAPSLVSARSWSYAGAAEFSDWFIIDIPPVAGETRVVNMLTKCYRNTTLGVKPTAHGEVYEL